VLAPIEALLVSLAQFRVDGFAADGRWFGAPPEKVVSVDGQEAEKLIPKIRFVIENYEFRWRLQPLAWSELEHVRSSHSRVV
jgi:hypothetical protein